MSRSLRTARESLRRTGNFAAGVFVGSALAAPAFADTALATPAIALDDFQLSILVGSLVLLTIGLALKVMKRRRPWAAVPPAQAVQPAPSFSEGIGRYRLQMGRGDAD
jgi:hypothetical protein